MSLLPSHTWGASPWSEPGTVQHTWRLIQERYADQPEVLKAFGKWARKTKIPETGATVWRWLTETGAKAALYDDVPGLEKSRAMRLAENAFIRRHALPRKDAPSKHVASSSQDAHALAMQKAALMLDTAHDDGGLTTVRLGRKVTGPHAAGEYRRAEGAFLARVDVREDVGTPLLTTLHELAHHIEEHIDPAGVALIARAARATERARHIAHHVGAADYWLSDTELFARAYAQFVAQATGDAEALEELRHVINGSTFWRVWPEDEWPELEAGIRAALTKKGWL